MSGSFSGKWLCATLVPLCLVAGCGGMGNHVQSQQTPQTKTYANDGYMGLSNTNPNLQNSPSYHTYGVDADMMSAAVAPIPGVRKVRIAANGTNATVHLTIPKELTEAEKSRIEQEALKSLRQQVPRYDFKVKLHSR